MIRIGEEILYLSRRDVENSGVTLAEIETVVERVFADKAAGRLTLVPKTTLRIPHGKAYFLAMPGWINQPAMAAVKWVGLAAPGSHTAEVPHLGGLIVLSDANHCAPLAVMDGTWITGVRTAAVSAVAARRLARPDSRRVGFIACGLQARTHLAALRGLFPLAEVVAFGRRRAPAEAFVAEARQSGVSARVVDDPRQAIEGMDIVVSSVPHAPGLVPFLDLAWLGAGAFVSMVDLGRSWRPEGFERMDILVTDDRDQTAKLGTARGMTYLGDYHADLGEIVTGAKPARRAAGQRAVFLHPGMALSDVAVAAAVFAKAVERGVGARLPL